MTEETANTLAEARSLATQVAAEARKCKQEFLSTIAGGISERAEGLAKESAHAQPEVAKALGKDGVRELRAELHAAAAQLAAEVESASDQINWPTPRSETSGVSSSGLHHALFDFMYGPRVNRLAAVFKRHGFNSQYSQVLPQNLYSENEQAAAFAAIADALNALGRAERALQAAEASHDRAVVESLWDDET